MSIGGESLKVDVIWNEVDGEFNLPCKCTVSISELLRIQETLCAPTTEHESEILLGTTLSVDLGSSVKTIGNEGLQSKIKEIVQKTSTKSYSIQN